MATNTFAGTRSAVPRPRDRTLYTQKLVALPPYWFGGLGVISGWIRDSGAVPQARRAFLYLWPHMTVVAVYDSDASNPGDNYFFNGLATNLATFGESFVVSVHNIDQTTEARIKDNLTPV